jgi:hypothetical protein
MLTTKVTKLMENLYNFKKSLKITKLYPFVSFEFFVVYFSSGRSNTNHPSGHDRGQPLGFLVPRHTLLATKP